MKILFVASEVVPFAKTGGLADVSGALPKALSKLGDEVKVIMPRYYTIDKETLEFLPISLEVDMGSMGKLWAGVYRAYLPHSKVEIYFIDYELFYGRSSLYVDENGHGYEDNGIRFAFLSKASLALSKVLDFKPDVIHANDWHSAAIPIMLKTINDPFYNSTKSLLTIHNLQFQGLFDKSLMDILGIDYRYFKADILEALGGINLLKGGIYFADAITTVSKKYAKEIQTKEFGFGLEDHIKAHSYKLIGILNGVDYDEWSPNNDRYIAKKYDIENLEDKIYSKRDLQDIFGLEQKDKVALIGIVSRFAEQKGIGLIASILSKMIDLPLEFVVLGSGEKWAEKFFQDNASYHKGKMGCFIGYNEELAHKIEAGCDMFLMPSLFEPCGLNQIYSLRYGTLPIVRATGGLDDTIVNYDPKNHIGNGFKFYDATPDALYNTIKWAVETFYHKKEDFISMQKRAMRERFTWERSAKEYQKVYQRITVGI